MGARERARLCLFVTAEGGRAACERTDAALAAAEPASLVIAPPAGAGFDDPTVARLVERAQRKGVAALVADDPGLAARVGADGVHLTPGKDLERRYEEARKALGGYRIVGVDAGRSRHDAMTVGEKGADYVGFGIPPHVAERERAQARRLDLVQWWAEIFEVPVVAFDVESPEEAAELAEAGADFVCVALPPAAGPDAIERRMAAFAAAVGGMEEVG